MGLSFMFIFLINSSKFLDGNVCFSSRYALIYYDHSENQHTCRSSTTANSLKPEQNSRAMKTGQLDPLLVIWCTLLILLCLTLITSLLS